MNESSLFWQRVTQILLFLAVVWGVCGFVMERQHRALLSSLEGERQALEKQGERLRIRIAQMSGKPHRDLVEIQAREVLGYVGHRDFILIPGRDSGEGKVLE